MRLSRSLFDILAKKKIGKTRLTVVFFSTKLFPIEENVGTFLVEQARLPHVTCLQKESFLDPRLVDLDPRLCP